MTMLIRPVTRGKRVPIKNLQLCVGLGLLALIVLMTVFAPLLTPYDPTAPDFSATLEGFSLAHPLGTDNLGRDIWARILYGARSDLFLACVAVLIPFILGSIIGALAGYFGGWFDTLVMRVSDIVVAFPFYVLVITLVFILGNGVGSIIVAISAVSWVAYARIVRAETMVLRATEFVDALKVGGLGHGRIVLRHLLPNVLGQAVVYAMSDIVANIGVIVTLSYFGLGIVPPTPDWGGMMADGQPFFTSGQYGLMLIPAVAVIITSYALSLVGDGLASIFRVTR